MKNNKIILDLCGGTGAWSKPYKDAGYRVVNITLPSNDVRTYKPPKNVYGILAAPPCTEFSLAKTTGKKRDLRVGMKIVDACLKIIWQCRIENKLAFWAIENPRCILRQFLGKPAFTFYQWEFGDLGLKPTDIWGYFKNPLKTKTERPKNMTKRYPCGSYNIIGWGKMSAEEKAITPQGFAKSFFKSNQ